KRPTSFIPSLVTLFISILFLVLGGQIFNSSASPAILDGYVNNLRNQARINIIEVRPSWLATSQVIGKILPKSPVFGVGPNQFAPEWLKTKPKEINTTPFWAAEFNYGIGLVPSFVATTGILGLLSWLILLAVIIYYGFRFVFSVNQDKSTRALLFLSFFGSVYLWFFSIFYVPDAFLWAMTFIVTGLFVAILADTKTVKNINWHFTKDPKSNFISVLFFTALIILSIVGGALLVQRFSSIYIHQQGLFVLNSTGDLDKSGELVRQAIAINEQDIYYRTVSQIDILQIQKLLATKDMLPEEVKARFKMLFYFTLADAKKATELDPANYKNWLALGKAYELVVPLGVKGAYEESKKAYSQAEMLDPTNPDIQLNYFGQLELGNKNIKNAKDYINKSLALKNDYLPAVSLLSQIDVTEGNADQAIKRLESYISAYPQNVDPGTLFQLGYLDYRQSYFKKAVSVLLPAINMMPNYANAKYFLGLSYDGLGQKDLARQQFEEILKSNPNNKEIIQIINNLRNGQSAVSNSTFSITAPLSLSATTTATSSPSKTLPKPVKKP
ncbi:MAG: tetratricopeptide repeat protein, partial [Candidatus Vogelbacteria bacterium]|nr:tetratricopeptide repeat protein [Candidatus Vogelbacteria bacterium]